MNHQCRNYVRAVSLLQLFAVLSAGNLIAVADEPRPVTTPKVASVTATIGDVAVRIDRSKLWTIGRIDYKQKTFGVEESAYGTVLNIKDVGFIGSSHKEVETENVTDLRFLLDGKLLTSPAKAIHGNSFKLERKSRIRSFNLDSELEIRANKLFQSVQLRTTAAVDLKVAYPLMYAWTPKITAYMFGADDGTRVSGKFRPADATQAQISPGSMDWLAVYDHAREMGTVSRLLTRPEMVETTMIIVDSPGAYRKFYVMSFSNRRIPAGFDGTYRMVTGFFEADAATWKTVAAKLAESLSRR